MADEQYDTLELVGLHEPDTSLELGPDGNKIAEKLPGMYSVGVMLGGRFQQIASFKAGNLVDSDNKVKTGGKQPSKSDSDSGDQSSGDEQKSE